VVKAINQMLLPVSQEWERESFSSSEHMIPRSFLSNLPRIQSAHRVWFFRVLFSSSSKAEAEVGLITWCDLWDLREWIAALFGGIWISSCSRGLIESLVLVLACMRLFKHEFFWIFNSCG
jgi:hypothetical protein